MGNRQSASKDPEQPGGPKKPVAGAQGLGMLHLPTMAEIKEENSCCTICIKIIFLIFSIYICAHALGGIAVSCIAANTLKALGNEFSSRVVSLMVITGTCAVTFCAALYLALSVCKTKSPRSLNIAATVLILMALIQALLSGFILPIGDQGAVDVARSLSDTFKLARDNNVKYVKVWSSVQSSLSCCGVYGAEDYLSHRVPNIFAPEVPASCCPGYDPDRSDQAQEKTREVCRARKTYYTVGCMNLAIEGASDIVFYVLAVISFLIGLEVLMSIFTYIIACQQRKRNSGAYLEGVRRL